MTDTERLDWLASNVWSPNLKFHYGSLATNLDTDDGDLRKAIDRAMEEDAGGNTECGSW